MAQIGFALKAESEKSDNPFPSPDIFTHVLYTGKTGSGKTTAGIYKIIEDRIRAGHSLFIYDEKAKEHFVIKLLAKRYGRLEDVLQMGIPDGIAINILDNMSSKQLEKFVRNIIKSSKDPFWGQAGINMLISTIEALIAIKKLYAYTLDTLKLKEYSLELTGTYQGKSKDAIQIDDDVEDMKVQCIINKEALTFAEVGIYFKDIIKFILLSGSGNRFVEMIESRVKYHLRKHHKTIKDLKVIKKVDQLLENAMKSVENLKPYKPSPDVAEASGNNGIYMTVASMMKEVSENEYISKLGNENFAKLLEDGKIIIVNTESFTMPINAMILDNVLHELSYRVKQSKKRAVTVVIDEANRVLSPESDLYTDILREAKGEIVMATQNHAQMIRKFGEIKWIQLSDNFLHQYYFSGKHKVSNMIKVLDEINGREFETEPYYFNQEELHAVEHEYQRMNHLYKEIVSESEHAIVLYDHQLYEHKNMLIKRDLETGDESMIEKEIHSSAVKGVIENHLEFITSNTVNILNESIVDH